MPGSPTTRVPLLHRRSDVLRRTCGRQAAHGLQHTQTDAAWPVLAVLSCAGVSRSIRPPTAAVSFPGCLGCCRWAP